MWRRRYLWLALFGALAAAAALVQAIDAIAIVPDKGLVDGCEKQARLEPVKLEGPPWAQHRLFLDANISFSPGVLHYVQDGQSGTIFRWPFVRNMPDGHARFAVQTRWTWLSPDWQQRPWMLLYDCAS
jgi:hypothetical protein